MPYASKAQQGFMHAKHPKIAKRWDKETKQAGGFDDLPEKKTDAMKRRLQSKTEENPYA